MSFLNQDSPSGKRSWIDKVSQQVTEKSHHVADKVKAKADEAVVKEKVKNGQVPTSPNGKYSSDDAKALAKQAADKGKIAGEKGLVELKAAAAKAKIALQERKK